MPLKLLDYGTPNPFGGIVGKVRHLAWPVNAYRVTLPKVSDDGDSLNPFERVILKIIDVGCTREPDVLSRDTCIPLDLVKSVLLRLRDKGIIDEHNLIQKDWVSRDKKPPSFVTVLLFRELATGKILPFLHWLSDNNPLKRKDPELKHIKKIDWDNDYKNSPPAPRDVISALRGMKRRSMAFYDEMHLPAIKQITIAREPEHYYLDCPIAIQNSDGEFRIADPFGMGFSLVIENAFSCLLEQEKKLSNWLMNWKEGLSNYRKDELTETYKEPYDNVANEGRYPKLISILRLMSNRNRTIEQIHAALEWAMFYTCARRPYSTAIDQLRLRNQSEHPNLLMKAAEKVGINPPQCGFLPVLGGKLDDFLSGKAEMGTVVSIALLMAESDVLHPLRRIAAHHQDFIIRIFEIKRKRDSRSHGKGKAHIVKNQLPEEVFMREIITSLLPAVQFSDTHIEVEDKDAGADLLLDARTSIQNNFGFKLFNKLGADLQNRLIQAESFWLSCKDGNDALTFACDSYAALQRAFRQRISGVLPPDIKDSELLAAAQQNAKQFQMDLLPECLGRVKPIAIRKTLQGNDQTLGSCVLSFLLVSSAETLRSIADTQPTFIADIAEIISRRGHGNEPLPLDRNHIGKLRKSTYSTIKTLLES
jgi:hypothetical protein